MKTRLLIKLMIAAVLWAMCSCKDTEQRRKGMLPPVTGAANEILVIMNNTYWEGNVGDTVKKYFQQPQLDLPQPEPMFDLLHLPISGFEKNVKSHRNVLIVTFTSKADSAYLEFYDSPWSESQKLFKIIAPSPQAFYKLFDKDKKMILSTFLKAERDRMAEVYKKNSSADIFRIMRDKYDILLYCPTGYVINKDTNDFVWISSETPHDSKGIIFFEEKYVNEGQFNYQVIVERVNEELKKYIPGPLKNTWMALDTRTPITAATYNFQGVHYAVMIRGLWNVVNDFMGGPFVLNVVLDEKNNRVIYMMGYVYAPESKKRNKIRQVESIIYNMQIDLEQDQEAAVGK